MLRRHLRPGLALALLLAAAPASAQLAPSQAPAAPAPAFQGGPPAPPTAPPGSAVADPGGPLTGTATPGTVTTAPPSLPVRADSDRHRAAALAPETGSATAQDPGGMPQLDFGNPLTIAQVVWLFILFGLLVYLATRYLLPPVAEVLENRRARIAGDLDAARDLRAEAEAAGAAHREATARARAEAQAAVAAAVAEAQGRAAARAETLSAALDARIAEAEARIAASRDRAMGALPEVATEAAEALVERLSGLREREAVSQAVSRVLDARQGAPETAR